MRIKPVLKTPNDDFPLQQGRKVQHYTVYSMLHPKARAYSSYIACMEPADCAIAINPVSGPNGLCTLLSQEPTRNRSGTKAETPTASIVHCNPLRHTDPGLCVCVCVCVSLVLYFWLGGSAPNTTETRPVRGSPQTTTVQALVHPFPRRRMSPFPPPPSPSPR